MHLEGVWQGTLTSTTDNQSYPTYLMIDGWGWSVVLTEPFVLTGPLGASAQSVIGGNLSGVRIPGTTWTDGSRVGYFSISGTIADDGFIDADYQSSVDVGVMALSSAENDVHSALGYTIGLWGLYDSNENILATLRFEGIGSWRAGFSGSHANGCTYQGETESWTSLHSFNFDKFSISDCPVSDGVDINGDYVGTGAVFKAGDDPSNQDLFAIALHNPPVSLLDIDKALGFFLRRIPE